MINYKTKNNSLLIVRDVIFFYCLGIFGLYEMFFKETLWKNAFPILYHYYDMVFDIYVNNLICLLWVCIVISFLNSKPNLIKYLLFLLLLIVGYKASIVQGDVYFYVGMLLIVASNGICAKRILVFWMSLNLPMLFITIVASKIGIIENWIELGRNREYLGYSWTTTPVMVFAYAVFEYLVLKKGHIKAWEFLVIGLIDLWLFIKTNTRFAFLIVLLVMLILMLVEYSSGLKRKLLLLRGYMTISPWICCLLVYIASVFYNPMNSTLYKINRLLSNRLKQCNYSLNKYPILTWGQIIDFVQTKYATPDNPATYVDTAYLQVLVRYGWLSLLAFLIISSYIMYRAYKEERYYIAIVFAAVLVFGLFEQQLYWFQFDMLLILSFADYCRLPSVDWFSLTDHKELLCRSEK